MPTLPVSTKSFTAPAHPNESVESSSVAAMPIATERVARESGLSQPYYQATIVDVQRIQAALRAAERGQTWLLETIFRDMTASDTHLNAEWQKRKMVICGQPMSLQPADPNNPDDVAAVPVIQEAIDHCRNWQEGLKHLLDATLRVTSVCEKIFEPISLSDSKSKKYKHLTRFRLKELAPVDYQLFCYQVPYQSTLRSGTENPATVFNADDWESWLRFYKTMPSGSIDYGLKDVYAPNPDIHLIHHGILQSPTIPPNFGGLIRALLFWWLFKTQDRDWWTLMMSRFGMPIPVAKVNSSNKQFQDEKEQVSLCEALDRLLNKGAVVVADVTVSVANIDLIYLSLQALVASVETGKQLRGRE